MSDTGRKEFTQSTLSSPAQKVNFDRELTSYAEAKEELTPDNAKSTQDKIKETFTDTTDRAARGGQSDESKSAPQQAFDKAQRVHDNESHGGASNSM